MPSTWNWSLLDGPTNIKPRSEIHNTLIWSKINGRDGPLECNNSRYQMFQHGFCAQHELLLLLTIIGLVVNGRATVQSYYGRTRCEAALL